jgi:1,2-diacylglycerol 3-alpha-glucosyltransferase
MPSEDTGAKPKLLIVCPGLDHVGRGFETLARDLFHALRSEGNTEPLLVKGSGRAGDGELVARTLRRDGAVARGVGRLLRRGPYGAYDVEQARFAAGLVRVLARHRPDVAFLSDLLTSRALAWWRRRMRDPFGLVVSNGGPWAPEFLRHADVVQELTPPALEGALAAGGAPERHTMLPLGVAMSSRPELPSEADRSSLRSALGLPPERQIVLSVGALTFRDKRLDYLIEELAAVPPPRPFLVLLGAVEDETPAVRDLAGRLLGASNHLVRTVPSREVADYYRAADVFALASLVEAFGRVMVEAMSHGLPCLAHDGPVQRYVLGPHGRFADLRLPGELTRLVSAGADASGGPDAARERHRFAHEHFSWDVLAPRYVELLRRCASRP